MADRMAERDGSRFEDVERLPGWDLVAAGMADLAAGRVTIAGELVRDASLRLAEAGLPVPRAVAAESPGRLYELVVADVGAAAAHGRYNALRRRLASFVRTARHAPAG